VKIRGSAVVKFLEPHPGWGRAVEPATTPPTPFNFVPTNATGQNQTLDGFSLRSKNSYYRLGRQVWHTGFTLWHLTGP